MPLNKRRQIAAWSVLQYETEFGRRLESVEKRDNERVL